jgi:hypothetical protein
VNDGLMTRPAAVARVNPVVSGCKRLGAVRTALGDNADSHLSLHEHCRSICINFRLVTGWLVGADGHSRLSELSNLPGAAGSGISATR